jgi:hypothetical protein
MQGLPVAIPQAQLVPTPQSALPQAHAFIVSHPPTMQTSQPMAPTITVQQNGAHLQQVASSSSSGGGEIGRKPSAELDLWQQSLSEKEKIFVRLNKSIAYLMFLLKG